MGLFKSKGREKEEGRKSNEDIIVEICETIRSAKDQMSLIKKEYEKVNGSLQDAQILSELPSEMQEEIKAQAKQLIDLKKSMGNLDSHKVDMSLVQIGLMERYEKELEKEIKKMRRDEEYKKAIEGDLRKLSGEKAVLAYEEREEKKRRRFLLRLGMISGFMIGFFLIMYFVFFVIFETFLELPFLATLAGGLLLVIYIFLETDRNKKAIQSNAAKRNKLALLTNKVKIKYVNQTSALDYSCDKYEVNTSFELEDRYKKYLIFKEEEKRRRQATSSYDRAKETLKNTLFEYNISDTELWIFHPHAVIEPKEMVEIRHNLNEKRGKLREMLEFNTRIVEENSEKLRVLADKFPENRRMIYEMAEFYKMELL